MVSQEDIATTSKNEWSSYLGAYLINNTDTGKQTVLLCPVLSLSLYMMKTSMFPDTCCNPGPLAMEAGALLFALLCRTRRNSGLETPRGKLMNPTLPTCLFGPS